MPRTLATRIAGFLLAGLAPVAAAARPVTDAGVVRFTYADTSARSVYLAGDFNGWSPTATPLDREAGAWVTRVFLDPGVYEYKFMADGTWHVDADDPEVSARGNSVVRVGQNGEVQSPRLAAPFEGETAAAGTSAEEREVDWSLRYIGLVTSRRAPAARRFALERPQHDVDLRLDARLTSEFSGWFLAKADNLQQGGDLARTALRFDRGQLLWSPAPYALRVFDNTGIGDFDDPGVLLGRVGIYGDVFGYGRAGAGVERKLLGAPIDLVYADDIELGENRAPATALPDLHGPGAVSLAGRSLQSYVTNGSHRDSDVLALRTRGGTRELGFGISYRLDRGGSAGRLAEVQVGSSGDTLRGGGREFETSETWNAWGFDTHCEWRGAHLEAEFLSGGSQARAIRVAPVVDYRAVPGSARTTKLLGEPQASDAKFDLDRSRRAIVQIQHAAAGGAASSAQLSYDYEAHDFTPLVTGRPFLMRRHTLQAATAGRALGVQARFDLEHHWFDYPAGANWETQFWFRRHVFWLDQDTVRFERLALLGAGHAAVAHLQATRLLAGGLRAEARWTYAAPGLDAAPRYVESLLRLVVSLRSKIDLRVQTRLATYRRFATADSEVVALLGPGAHIEAGSLDRSRTSSDQASYRTFVAHYVEIVYSASPRADLSLGFGVRPLVLYPVTNEYAEVGVDTFLFEQGASPGDALADPLRLGSRLERAERALERERRLSLQARVRF